MESRMIIDEYGTKRWYDKRGKIHREDGPAVIWKNGDKDWFQNGQLHRDDGPAMIDVNGDRYWYRNGERHREDGPAVIGVNGEIGWWLENKKYAFTEWANELNLDQRTRLEMVLKWNPE